MPLYYPRQPGASTAVGDYAGNDGNGRQIPTGFRCAFVLIHEYSGARRATITGGGPAYGAGGIYDTNAAHNANAATVYLMHDTDGFIVDSPLNTTGKTYYWCAVSRD